MKIAVITITQDDNDRIEQWSNFYDEYKNNAFLHIIVDNASSISYKNKLKKTFSDSIIIERETNGGCTGAYNDGIKYCLDNTDVDAIALIANDIKLSVDALQIMYQALFSKDGLCLVSVADCYPGTDIINNFGHSLGDDLTMRPENSGDTLGQLKIKFKYTTLVNGGVNMAKASFYRNVGLQDNNLFMYSDEVDTGIRAQRAGLKIGVTAEAVSWHYHISSKSVVKRKPYSRYLSSRNKIYIANKFYDSNRVKTVYRSFMKSSLTTLFFGVIKCKKDIIESAIYSIQGLRHGKKGDMLPNKYSTP